MCKPRVNIWHFTFTCISLGTQITMFANLLNKCATECIFRLTWPWEWRHRPRVRWGWDSLLRKASNWSQNLVRFGHNAHEVSPQKKTRGLHIPCTFIIHSNLFLRHPRTRGKQSLSGRHATFPALSCRLLSTLADVPVWSSIRAHTNDRSYGTHRHKHAHTHTNTYTCYPGHANRGHLTFFRQARTY